MMGAGKSSIGRALADLTGREFVDTDTLLQNRLGRPIPQIFKIYGEDTFREHESSILRNIEPGPIVLATGGGIVLRPENWETMRQIGITVFLDAAPQTIKERLQRSKKKRPLLDAEDWEDRIDAILEKRMPLYRQADVIVPVDDVDLDEGARRVADFIQSKTL